MKIRKIVLMLTTSLLFGVMFLTSTNASAHSSASRPLAMKGSLPQWIVAATPFIHMRNYTITIDPAIRSHVSASDVTKVRQMVNEYNELPLSVKSNNYSGNHAIPMSPSCWRASVSYPWWGESIYVNDCFIRDLVNGAAIRAVVVNFFVAIGVLGPLALAMAVASFAVGGVLYVADRACGYKGAYFNMLAGNPSSVWVWGAC